MGDGNVAQDSDGVLQKECAHVWDVCRDLNCKRLLLRGVGDSTSPVFNMGFLVLQEMDIDIPISRRNTVKIRVRSRLIE